MANNIYGHQEVEETEERTAKDGAKTVGNSAMHGYNIGSNFGPVGGLIGAAAGALKAIPINSKLNREAREQRRKDQEYNAFVGNLEGRQERDDFGYIRQARNGMNTDKYVMAEIEGDGTGRKYSEGIGEIHTDKNFNIKNMANGQPKHEEGGVKVIMEEGDIVFPTQGSEKKYKKILNDIRRYKTYGDERAKKRLEKERDKRLPIVTGKQYHLLP